MENRLVLIVNDDPGLRRNLADMLQGKGCQVLTAGYGGEGLALAGQRDVHLTLAGFQLADMSGLEMLERIKGENPAAEVILISGPATLETAVAAANRLSFSLLVEPFDADQFQFLVGKALAKQASEEALRLRQRAVELTGNGILIADATLPDHPAVYANPAFERITGYSAEETLGRNPRFLHQSDREQPGLEELRRILRQQQEGIAVLRNFRKDGKPFWNELSIVPVQNARGRVTHFIGILNDVTERKRFEERLAYQSNHDGLTGLPNRSLLMDRIRQALFHAQRHRTQAAILFIDLDNFKFINDTLGHHKGDGMLKIIAARLGERIRSMDTLARHGGDEFVVVLSDLGQSEHAALVAQKFMEAVSQPLVLGEDELAISCSIGISIYPKDGKDGETLLKNADVALYRAKEQGRNNFQFYTDALNKRVVVRMTMEKHLRRALEREEFLLHYQPQAELQTGRITGMEALIRWQSPDLGFIPPARFIPLAEETGLIAPIGEWVLETACRQNQAWQDAGLSALTIAINLSPRQFQQPDLVDKVAQTLGKSRLEPAFLELEIVESMLMHDVNNASSLSRQLKELGVRLTMDDFGTGYSNLSYLKLFPFDSIKIDRSFVRNITSDPDSAAIARAIIALAHSLKLRVVGEGVETAGQLHYLRSHGCDEIQGFYFSRPVPPCQFEQMLLKNRQLSFGAETADEPWRTLLLVDDEPHITAALKRVLSDEGYRILTAASAAEGFEQLAVNRVGVVVADEHMPRMDGTEFLGRVKELYPDIVRVVLTGSADFFTVTEAVNRGAIFKFLTKPWEEESFLENIREAFKRYKLFSEKEK